MEGRIRTSRSPSKRATPRMSSNSSSTTRQSDSTQCFASSPKAFVSFPSLSPEPEAGNWDGLDSHSMRKSSVPSKLVYEVNQDVRSRSSSTSSAQAQSSAINRTVRGAANLRKSIMAALTTTAHEAAPQKAKSVFALTVEDMNPLHAASDEQILRLIDNKGGPLATVRQFSADIAEANARATQEQNSKQTIVEENRMLRAENEELRRKVEESERRLEAAAALLRETSTQKHVNDITGESLGYLNSLDSKMAIVGLISPSMPRSLEQEAEEAEVTLRRVLSAPLHRIEFDQGKTLKTEASTVAPMASRKTGPRHTLGISRHRSETLEMKTPMDDDQLPPVLRQYRTISEEGQVDRLGFLFTANREQRHQEAMASYTKDLTDNNSVDGFSHNDTGSSSSIKDLNFPDDGSQATSEVSNADLLCYTPITAPLRLVSFGGTGQQKFVDTLKSLPITAHTSDAVTVNAADLSQQKSREDSHHGSAAASSVSMSAATPPNEQGGSEGVKALNSLLTKLNDTYDAQQQRRQSEWKSFESQVRAAIRKTPQHERSHDYSMASIARLCSGATASSEITKRFNTLLAHGVPASARQEVWMEKTGANAMRIPGLFDLLVARDPSTTYTNNAGGASSPTSARAAAAITEHDIAADVERTLGNNVYFRSGEGRSRLRSVLTAYSRHNPSIGYSQGLNIIAANLLLLCSTAEDAFWLLVAVIDNVLPWSYYHRSGAVSAEALETDGRVLDSYVSELLPKLHSHLVGDLDIDLTWFTPGWFISGFSAALSGEALFRFWDLLLGLCDGKLVFCMALALLKVNRKALIACETYEEGMLWVGGKMTSAAVGLDALIREVLRFAADVAGEELKSRRSKFGSKAGG